jgi:ubiquinol-cytochrome c reductase cytochrome b subunit
MSKGFFESRTAWSKLKEKLLLEPLPGGSRWAAAFGSLLLFSFIVQVVTGILLSMNYSPSVESSWPSVNHIINDIRFGSLVRSIHHWGSSAMVVLLLAHLVQVFVWGAYKRPREFTWMIGVLLLILTLGLAFTGYLLPWDQKAYWATKVGLGITSTAPVIGESVKSLLQGGPSMGNPTLTRFFSIHVFILPGLLILLVVIHLYLFRLHGVTPPWWESEVQLEAEKEPFWPGQAFKDGVFALIFLAVLFAWAHWHPAPLEAKADPSQPYEARPEWYFMFLFYLLQFFKGPYEVVGTFVLPALFFLVLFFWPFLDRNPRRSPTQRPIAIGLLSAASCSLIGLTIFAIATDVRMHEPQLVVAKAPAPPRAGPLQLVDVANLFASNCAACHAVDGKGDKVRPGMPNIPDFTSLSWQLGHTDLHLTQGILEGKPPQMPSYREKLRPDEATALAIYVRAFVVPPHPDVLPNTAEAKPLATLDTQPARAEATPAQTVPPDANFPSQSIIAAPVQPAELYTSFCLACHGSDGRGKLVKAAMPKIPDFADTQWQATVTDEVILAAIMQGKGQFMLPFKGKLNESEARSLASYVRGFTTAPPTAVTQSEGPTAPSESKRRAAPTTAPGEVEVSERIAVATAQYRRYCLACHGTDGRGAPARQAMPTIPNFTDIAWQASHNDSRLAISILEGYGKLMPPFRDHLKRVDSQALTAYVRAFGPHKETVKVPVQAGDLEERMRQLQGQWRDLEQRIKNLP